MAAVTSCWPSARPASPVGAGEDKHSGTSVQACAPADYPQVAVCFPVHLMGSEGRRASLGDLYELVSRLHKTRSETLKGIST